MPLRVSQNAAMKSTRSFIRRFGPGLITASVVLGPGSIVAAGRAGAQGGYRLFWLIVASVLFMAAYTSMGARLGCALEVSPLTYVARRAGRWLAVVIGLAAFFATAGFQFGNNIGVAVAANALTGAPAPLWPILFTIGALFFLLYAKQIYKRLETLMIALVAIMIVCFLANLVWTGISVPRLVGGLVPRIEENDGLIARGMLATTFSAAAAFYQAYLVRAKQWRADRIHDVVRDAWAGIAVLGLISTAILIGAAETLHGSGQSFRTIGELAGILDGVLGPAANVVFSCGLAAAAFSSFLVNALIGGGILADGLGLDAALDGKPTRILAAVVMIVGSLVAMTTLLAGAGAATSLLVAQASTLFAAPLCAIVLLVLTSNAGIMGNLKNSLAVTTLGVAGLLAIVWLGIEWLGEKVGG